MQDKREKRTLLITGGHVTPAIAVIEELQKDNRWRVVFFGREFAQEGSKSHSREKQEIPKRGVKFITIPAGKVPRHLNTQSLLALLRIPLGFIAASWHLSREKPDVILTFGGFLAAPTALVGKVLGVPIIMHEQTLVKGLANSLVERFADVVTLSWEESRVHFRRSVAVIGDPLRKAILQGAGEKLPIKRKEFPLLYITGGNQGAHAINAVIKAALPRLLKKYAVVHQCGSALDGEDYKELVKESLALPGKLRARYLVRDWFNSREVSWLLSNADLVVSRAGANTVAELAYSGTPALLIPLPIAGRNEQRENALHLKRLGSAEILKQENLNVQSLQTHINNMLKKAKRYKAKASEAKGHIPHDAAEKLVELVNETYEKTEKTSGA